MRARVGVTESHREPERDRERASESQREPDRATGARVGVTENHREPKRDRERDSKSQREPQREPVRARGNQSELETTNKSHSEPEGLKESSQAYLSIVLLQNN